MKKAVVCFGILLVGVLLVTSGCSKKQRTIGGALIGAAAGAGIGGIAGGGGGAVAGGLAGGLLGGVVGHSTAKNKKRTCGTQANCSQKQANYDYEK